ncbi:hypothetical protein [Leucobacter komagatae]|nr:hypothetical protein [Leucobacter komagatae]
MNTTSITLRLSRAEDLYDLQAWDEARHKFDRYPHALTAEEVARKYL